MGPSELWAMKKKVLKLSPWWSCKRELLSASMCISWFIARYFWLQRGVATHFAVRPLFFGRSRSKSERNPCCANESERSPPTRVFKTMQYNHPWYQSKTRAPLVSSSKTSKSTLTNPPIFGTWQYYLLKRISLINHHFSLEIISVCF